MLGKGLKCNTFFLHIPTSLTRTDRTALAELSRHVALKAPLPVILLCHLIQGLHEGRATHSPQNHFTGDYSSQHEKESS